MFLFSCLLIGLSTCVDWHDAAQSQAQGATLAVSTPMPSSPRLLRTSSFVPNQPRPSPAIDYSAPDSIALRCKENARSAMGSYLAENNMWGRKGVQGKPVQCTGIGVMAADGSVSARWHWNWPAGPSEVKAYPQLIYGQKPGYRPTPSTNLPIRVSDIKTATSRWDTNSTFTGLGQLSFDLWLTRDAQRYPCFNCTPITHEIMIPVEPYGGYGVERNPSWFFDDAVIDGHAYKVYTAENFGTIGWRFIVMQSVKVRTAGSVNLKAILRYLKEKKLIDGDEYLASVEFGSEPVEGSGDVHVKSFKVEVN